MTSWIPDSELLSFQKNDGKAVLQAFHVGSQFETYWSKLLSATKILGAFDIFFDLQIGHNI